MIVCGFDVGLLWRVFGCAVGCADPSPAAETATSPASGRGGRALFAEGFDCFFEALHDSASGGVDGSGGLV